MTPRSKRGSEKWPSLPLLTIVIVIASLYLGKDLVVPFALAGLISFLLTRPVGWLERCRLGRPLSVFIVVTLAFSAAGAALWMGAVQLSGVVGELPHYQRNIRRKIEAVKNPGGQGLAKAAASIEQITTELSPSAPAEQKRKALSQQTGNRNRSDRAQQPPPPVPVEVVKHPTSTLESLGLLSTSLARFFGEAGAVVILTLFMLMKRDDLRNRLVRLWGQGHLVAVTTAIDDAAERVSRYLLTQSLVNGTFGLLLGFGLYWIGLPYSAFWGVFGALLRFIPYVGTLVAGMCPVLLALAVFDGWTRPLLTLGLFVTIEAITSGIVEPWLYATRTGISSLAILVSAAFWTLLWGPIGLVLSTPLTVCLAVLGRYVPQLEFLYVLLGDEPVLSPEAHYYQRLLAMDEDEATEVIETHLREKDLGEVYDSVLIPALSMAEQDRHQDRLEEERERFIYQSSKELIQELGERAAASSDRPAARSLSSPPLCIRCLPARDRADELVALMLAQLLRRSGHDAEAIPLGSLEDMLAHLAQAHADVLFISALPPFALTHARSVCRRARQQSRELKIAVGLWNSAAELERSKERLGSDCAEYVMTSLAQAESQVRVFEGSIALQKS